MKKQILFLLIFAFVKIQAQNYKLSFTASGASNTIDSIIVENLTQNTSIVVRGTDTLELSVITGINQIRNNSENSLRISPNPMTDKCIIDFEATAKGETSIELFDIAGKKIIQSQEFLMKGHNKYRLSGLGTGLYFLKVRSDQYSYSAKIVSGFGYQVSGNAELKHIETVSAINQQSVVSNNESLKGLKGNNSLKYMNYNIGDRIMLKSISGIYIRIYMLIVDKSQTVNFEYISCIDLDGNHYAVVGIGTQIWMAENLKTTKFNNGTAIPNVIDSTNWVHLSTPGFCWYKNDSAYKPAYGGLYNWYAASTGKLCPSGWHVPYYEQWDTLVKFLGGYGTAGGNIKETGITHWDSPNLNSTNSSGFTALPGGERTYDGSYINLGLNAFWWSDTDMNYSLARNIYTDPKYNNISLDYGYKTSGYSVRCIRN